MTAFLAKPAGGKDHVFFFTAGAALLAVVFAGFARTYYLKLFSVSPPLPFLVHLHGAVMTLWFLLFPVQVALIATRRVVLHRRLGAAGVVLGGIAAVLAAMVSLGLARDRIARRPSAAPEAALLLGLQLFAVLLVFAILVSLGVAYRRRSDFHKRFMTLAMLSVLGPAITRLPLHFIRQHDVSVTVILSLSCVAVCILADTVRRRRLHPAFGWGGALIFGSLFLVAQFAQTRFWIGAVRRMLL
jgi:hypothetical protein